MKYTSNYIRLLFLEFYKSKNHKEVSAASLFSYDSIGDFTVAGVQQFIPFLYNNNFLPYGKRIVNYQKCFRINDINKIGKNFHLILFEMLGNWSFGDYFKKESLKWSYEFLTSNQYLGLDSRKIAVTIFGGDKDINKDLESLNIWLSLGIPNNRIFSFGKDENWWSGIDGPCGPDSEIFYRVGKEDFPPISSNVKNNKNEWIELCNNVFIEYIKEANGIIIENKYKCVDVGFGLERLVMVCNDKKSLYDIDMFVYGKKIIEKKFNIIYDNNSKRSINIIIDYLRACILFIYDGLFSQNLKNKNIVRKLLILIINETLKLGDNDNFILETSKNIIDNFKEFYPNIKNKEEYIYNKIIFEEKKIKSYLNKKIIMDNYKTLLKENYNSCLISGLSKSNIEVLLYHIKYIKNIEHKKFFELSFKSNFYKNIPLNISLSLLNSKEHKYYGDDLYNLFTIYIYIGKEIKLNDQAIGSMSFGIGKNDIFCFNIQRGLLSKALFENKINYVHGMNKIIGKLHRILFYILNYFYISLNKKNIYGFSDENHPCNNHNGFVGNYNNFYKSYGFLKIGKHYIFNKGKLKNKNFLKYYDIDIKRLDNELLKIIKIIKNI